MDLQQINHHRRIGKRIRIQRRIGRPIEKGEGWRGKGTACVSGRKRDGCQFSVDHMASMIGNVKPDLSPRKVKVKMNNLNCLTFCHGDFF